MEIKSILKIQGIIIIILGFFLAIPTILSFVTDSSDFKAFVLTTFLCFAFGGALSVLPQSIDDFKFKDGFAVATLGWFTCSFVGGLPFYLSGTTPLMIDAFFESASGFTTTGASILNDIEALSNSMLLWRSMTQWLGGMGIVVLSLAIIPYLELGGMSIFQAEVPGPMADKLTPRIQDTAKVLWLLYLFFTITLCIILYFCGMTFFDSINHSLTTMATGGFSTKNTSLAFFNSPLIEMVITLFMLIAGTNFALHYFVLFKGFNIKTYFEDSEFKFYLFLIFSSVLIILIYQSYFYGSVSEILTNSRNVLFTVVSIVTSTGFVTFDYDLWSFSSQFLLLFLMITGGCAGSTGGGVKVIRILLVLKYMYNELLKLIHPNMVKNIVICKTTIAEEIVAGILGFVFIYVSVMAFSIFLLANEMKDLTSAISAVITCLSNIGPGLNEIGPTNNFSHLSSYAKTILSINMIMGRLEILTVIILFIPQSWRR